MKILRWRVIPGLAMLLASGQLAAGEPAAIAAPAPARNLNRHVDDALKKGVDYLLQHKSPERGAADVAPAAIRLYALLQVGRSIDDPRLRGDSAELAASARWLAVQQTGDPAATAFKALALCALEAGGELKTHTAETRNTLLKFLAADGAVAATSGGPWNTTQTCWTYAALAALQDSGLDVHAKIWQAANTWWRAKQNQDGGWPAGTATPASTPRDTAAGLWGVFLAGSMAPPPERIAAGAIRDSAVDAAVKKLLDDFDPGSADRLYLYQFERAASLAGLRLVKGVDWYPVAAEALLKTQRADGSWAAATAGEPNLVEDSDALQTALALLFLARGRDPVPFNKLEYDAAGGAGGAAATAAAGSDASHWNDRPRDAANLTAWLARQFDKPLNWQTVSLRAPPDQWGSAPILLITGSGDPGFSPEDIARLRAFVLAGGLIFSSADGGDSDFTNAITKKYAPLLAEKRYEMRPLPESHELFSGDLYARIANPPALLGLSNGVREWWIHSPVDMGANWQLRRSSPGEFFSVPANMVRYATGNGPLPNKLQTLPQPPATAPPPTRAIHLARLEYGGNFDPEPAAWPRLAAFAPSCFHTQLKITTVKPLDLDVAKTPVAHLTGTTSFSLTDDQVAALKKFLDAGGTLLADSAGGSDKFSASMTALAAKLYPDAPLAELAVNDPVLNGSIADTVRLPEVQYRKYAVLVMKERLLKPHVQAVTIHGRHVILFSPEDFTSGLLGTHTWGIRGYTPDSSQDLARNLLLYAVSR